jgi:5-methyltetrahydrofolate--homocysteine methyltransferase
MDILKHMAEAVIAGDAEHCVSLAKQAMENNLDPVEVIQQGFSKGMDTVGGKFESGEMFLPEMMQAAEAMKGGVAVLRPAIESTGSGSLTEFGKAVLATIQGDMHDIGKNIVKLLLSTSGFEIIDLGKDVKVAVIIDKAEEIHADVIGVSALMTTTMGYMPELIQELQELGIKEELPVMVGGAPVTEEWAKEIGADGYAKDAVGAVRTAKGLAKK